jgi:hypothetical protein
MISSSEKDKIIRKIAENTDFSIKVLEIPYVAPKDRRYNIIECQNKEECKTNDKNKCYDCRRNMIFLFTQKDKLDYFTTKKFNQKL